MVSAKLVHYAPSGEPRLRLRRLLCGKALPFRRADVPSNLLGAGWKAQPSSLRQKKREGKHAAESRRLSAQRGGRAALQTAAIR